jgi:hypothetical protein
MHSSLGNGSPTSVLNNVYAYSNIINTTSACLYGFWYWPSYVQNSYIFNNLEVAGGSTNSIGVDSATNGNALYNNTIINTSSSNSGMGIEWNYGVTLTFENNAVQGWKYAVFNGTASSKDTTVTADYNAYAECLSTTGCFDAFGVWVGSFSTYQTSAETEGQESHSLATSPLNTTTLGLNASYAPTTSSVVYQKGANLYSLCNGQSNPGIGALCYDLAGNARPSSGAWDIGAYEYFQHTGRTSSTSGVWK